jgi:hypothetical protein
MIAERDDIIARLIALQLLFYGAEPQSVIADAIKEIKRLRRDEDELIPNKMNLEFD